MRKYIAFILIWVSFVDAETINIGGGGNEQCDVKNLITDQPENWHYPLFPIPVVIDSRIGEKKATMYIYATMIWNKVYRTYLEKYLKKPGEYPQKLFSYFIVTGNYSDYKESSYIIWTSEKLLPNQINGTGCLIQLKGYI